MQPKAFVAATLDHVAIAALLANAPPERSVAARQAPLVISLPDPNGGFQRFTVEDSPVMEAALAAKHPNIRTFAGRGIDDPTASVRMDITPLGFHASVRSKQGAWYIDPYYHLDTSVYVSYRGRDLVNPRAPLTEGLLNEPVVNISRGLYRASDTVQVLAAGFTPGAQVLVSVQNLKTDTSPRQLIYVTASKEGTVSANLVADPYKNIGNYTVTLSDGKTTTTSNYRVVGDRESTDAQVGTQLRTYRLALLTDPAYAAYFTPAGGAYNAANTTAAKVTLMNRVTQVYEAETSIRLKLIGNNDVLNLDSAAQFSGINGPCGATACYPTAEVGCTGAVLSRTRLVIGMLVGASNFDIGHIAVGAGGGGVANLGVVGGNLKAQGCTGLPTPVGDLFAVDYVAHEIGHQFAGNHTFNGVAGNCTGNNRSAANSFEPGSGSSIMAYAGICGADDLQPHSDPYWSQRSFDEIVAYTSAAETSINEVQYAALTNFTTNGQQFVLRYNGNDSAPIVRGTNFTTAGVKATIEAIPGWPTGGTVNVSTLSDSAFTVTFTGALVATNVNQLQLVGCSLPCTGYVAEITKGGLTTRGGFTVTPTGNTVPAVTVPSVYTIPLRTPFALTASATDADGDTITYMWEQNDRGANTGTGLLTNGKTDGPLFRQFGTRAVVTSGNSLIYESPGQNGVTTNPTRVFPDLPQILANNTNAMTGACPTASPSATATEIDCFSEFLPTSTYAGFSSNAGANLSLNFKVTARDGKGGVNSASTQLLLATSAGPFLVTAPNTAITASGGQTQTVSWNVANTDAAPVNTANVKISLSVDGGFTYPYTLASSTPNNGSKLVLLPNVATTIARVKVEALGNVFFDVSNANFTIRMPGDVDGNNTVNCIDLNIVKASMGKSTGQVGFDARADLNNDGRVDIRDLVLVSRMVAAGTICP